MKTRSTARGQRGLSILEVVIAVAIIGMLTIAAWKLKSGVAVMTQDRADSSLLKRSGDAILAFAVSHSRLPCPAAPGQAVEDCSRIDGNLPWQSIGLPDASAGSVRYTIGGGGIFRKPPPRIDVLHLDGDRQLVSATFDPAPLGAEADIILDFCGVLGSALKGGVPMAYSLRRAPPASGDASPPGNAGVSLERSVPSLWSGLHCGDLIAAAPRAHANAALAADMMRYAADEKEVLAGINHDAAVAAAVFAVLDAVIQTARVPYKAMTAAMACTNMSSQLIDIGAGSGDGGQISALAQTTLSCLTSAVTIATHIANVVSNWVGVGVAIDKLARLDEAALAHRQAHADAVRALAADVNAHAQESVYRGLYLR